MIKQICYWFLAESLAGVLESSFLVFDRHVWITTVSAL